MKKLGLDSGTGSDGVLPSRRANMRVNRQAGSDGEGCNNVLANWKKFNTSGDAGVPGLNMLAFSMDSIVLKGTDGPIDEKNIDATVDTLNTLNNSPTLEDDLKGCQQETSRQTTVVLVIVQIRSNLQKCYGLLNINFRSGFMCSGAAGSRSLLLKSRSPSSPSPSASLAPLPPLLW